MKIFKKVLMSILMICLVSCNQTVISSSDSISENGSSSSLSSERKLNLNPDTMVMDDFRDIDLSWIKYGEVREKKEIDLSNVEIENKRTPASDEVEVIAYLFENDLFAKAEYHYLKIGGDYSGKGEYYFTFEYYPPNCWYGLEADLCLIGLYSDPEFKNLIDPKLIECVSEELDVIYVRSASKMYVYRCVFDDVYTNGIYEFEVSDCCATFTVDGVNYKIALLNHPTKRSQLYINGELVEDYSRWQYGCFFSQYDQVYTRTGFYFYLDGEAIVPKDENWYNYFDKRVYSSIAYL